MSWNNNDGPWGSPSSGNAPRGQRGGNVPPQMPQPPDFDKIFQWLKNLSSRFGGTGNGHITVWAGIFAVLFVFWLLSGFYQVGTEQKGVVLRFGAFLEEKEPGLRYHLPYPIEDVLLPNVTSQNEIQVGFRRIGRNRDEVRTDPEESMMLTQDQNIINVEFTVFWRVGDIQKFLFEIRDPEKTIKMAAESTMREVIGQNKLQYALTDGRAQIADKAKERLQALMDDYNAGVIITQVNLQTVSVPEEVKAAFQDVVNARLDQERFRNEADAHANKVVPEAKGQAARIKQEALAYHDQKIAIAQGEADRFKSVLAAYNSAPEVIAKRMYLEMMEDVLGTSRKIVMDKAGSGAVPYLPLNDLMQSRSNTSSEGVSR